jgi:uncharacterized membrane protein YeiB
MVERVADLQEATELLVLVLLVIVVVAVEMVAQEDHKLQEEFMEDMREALHVCVVHGDLVEMEHLRRVETDLCFITMELAAVAVVVADIMVVVQEEMDRIQLLVAAAVADLLLQEHFQVHQQLREHVREMEW